MAFAEDFAPFLDTVQGFAVTVTWNAQSVNGIFDDGHIPVDAGGEVRFESTAPTFLCAAADVPTVAHGQTIVINATTYTIRGVHPDGTGMVNLVLEKP